MRYPATLFALFFSASLYAQTAGVNVGLNLPSVALVDLISAGASSFTLSMAAPTEAGLSVSATSSTNSSQWLIFTSAVASGVSRSIKGDLIGALPGGVRLKLVVSPYVGSGSGVSGGSSFITGNAYLTSTPTSFISNIKGAFTGTTLGSSGFKMTYSLEIQNYANIRSGSSSVTVRYTISDN